MPVGIKQAALIAKEYVVESSGYQNVKLASPKKVEGKITVKATSSGKEWTIEIDERSGKILNVSEKDKHGHYRADTIRKRSR